jgi:hypothetical protein
MNQLTVKRLTGTDHLLECFEISKIKNKVGGSKAPSPDGFIEGYTPYFEDHDDRYVFGCFEDGKLISWIAIGFVDFTIGDTTTQFWAISALYTTKFVKLFSFNNPEIGLLIKEAFQLAESKKFYTYYYSISKRVSKVYETQIQKTKYIPIGRYDYFEVAIVPANTQPVNPLHWRLMGQELKPDDILIKKRVLRSEHR